MGVGVGNRWKLSPEVRAKYKSELSGFMNKLWFATAEDLEGWGNDECSIDFSDTELRPYTLMILMEEEFGYTEHDFNDNGWELDFWITLRKPDVSYPSQAEEMCIHGCGMTFELRLSVKEWM